MPGIWRAHRARVGRVLVRAVSVRPVRTSVEAAPVCELRGCLLDLWTQSRALFSSLFMLLHATVRSTDPRAMGERAGRVLGRVLARAVSVRPVCTFVEGAAVCELRG